MGSITSTTPPPSGTRTRAAAVHRRRRRTAALVAVAAFAFTACASDDEAASEDSAAAIPVSEQSAEEADGIAGGDVGEAMDDAPQTGGAASSGLPVALEDRDIITSVGLTMSTSDVRQTADDIRRITATSGGVVFSSEIFLEDARDDGSVPGGGQIVIKVAPADLDALVADLDGIGVVTRLAQDAQDVTDQLIDLDIRIRQAESGIARIELLLEEATALDDVFAIENELNERQIELERLRAAERNTDDLVALATLTVQVEYRTPDALDEIAEPRDGIGDAFADGWNAFVGAVFALGYVLAITAPFLVTLSLVLLVAWVMGRRWSRRQAEAREQRRLDADLRGDRIGYPVHPSAPGAVPNSPPPPPAADRIPETSPTAVTTLERAADDLDASDGSDSV